MFCAALVTVNATVAWHVKCVPQCHASGLLWNVVLSVLFSVGLSYLLYRNHTKPACVTDLFVFSTHTDCAHLPKAQNVAVNNKARVSWPVFMPRKGT